MIYKVVPAAMVVPGTGNNAATYFQNIINENAKNGWQFYCMETATTEESPGCALFNATPQRTQWNMLIFCKPEPGDVVMHPGTPSAPTTPAPKPSTPSAPSPSTPKAPTTPAPKPKAPSKPLGSWWTCQSCGNSNSPTATRCDMCGTARPNLSSGDAWICKECGTSNKTSYGSCKKCGTYRKG